MQGIPGVTAEDASEYGVRCAYCEALIHHAGHIEHFRRKNRHHPNGYPELTFAWSNLFLACGSRTHCGHYKDGSEAPAYDPDELIKPDQHDPEHYLYFHSSGEVRPRHPLNAADTHRAEETIRVFGLNNASLPGERKKALRVYREKIAADLDELADWPSEDREAYLCGEIEATRWDPYATTIKHFLQNAA
jgi:uncharacterized protein (TIGR02646 family)